MTAPDGRPGRRVPAGRLTAFAIDVFVRLGVAADDAAFVAQALCEASLAGYDSHGAMRLPGYARDIRAGRVDVRGRPVVEHESGAVARIDGANALGPITARHAIEVASARARACGIGCAATRRTHDVACLGVHVRAPAEAGLIAMLYVNDAGGGAAVLPSGGSRPFLSTNPIAAGIPTGEGTIIIDLSTAVVAIGKLRMAWNRGASVPAGWLSSGTRVPVTEPALFFTEPRAASLLPLGSDVAGHKGFALGLLVDVLAGALGGAGTSTGSTRDLSRNGVCAIVIDPEHFGARDDFLARVRALVEGLRASTPGVVRMPGEHALHERAQRLAQGIPIDAPTSDALAELGASLGLAPLQ